MEDRGVLRAVGGEDDGHVIAAQTALGQTSRDPADRGGQLTVGVAAMGGVDDGRAVGVIGAEFGEQELRQADLRDGDVRVATTRATSRSFAPPARNR